MVGRDGAALEVADGEGVGAAREELLVGAGYDDGLEDVGDAGVRSGRLDAFLVELPYLALLLDGRLVYLPCHVEVSYYQRQARDGDEDAHDLVSGISSGVAPR